MSNRIPTSENFVSDIRYWLREGRPEIAEVIVEDSHKAWRRWGKEVSRKERLDLERR